MNRPPDTRPPEARLIFDARMAIEGMSFRKAAAEATRRFGKKMSEGSWRRTESTRNITRTPETVAMMAGVVNITPAQLERAGRPDAARRLEQLLAAETASRKTPGKQMTRDEAMALAAQLRAWADQIAGDGIPLPDELDEEDDEEDVSYRIRRA